MSFLTSNCSDHLKKWGGNLYSSVLVFLSFCFLRVVQLIIGMGQVRYPIFDF